MVDVRQSGSSPTFALTLPGLVVCDLMELAPSMQPTLLKWLHQLTDAEICAQTNRELARSTAGTVRNYFLEAIDQRRAAPANDLLTLIALARPDGAQLDTPEVASLCMLLFLAGIDTTSSLIGKSILWLWMYPQQRQALADDPALIPAGVEELLRYDPPVHQSARTVTKDVVLAGSEIPADSRVVLLFASANRDERHYPDAEILDVRRNPDDHLAFGEGIYRCLGAPLARLETRIALQELLAQFPGYTVVSEPEGFKAVDGRALRSLDIELA